GGGAGGGAGRHGDPDRQAGQSAPHRARRHADWIRSTIVWVRWRARTGSNVRSPPVRNRVVMTARPAITNWASPVTLSARPWNVSGTTTWYWTASSPIPSIGTTAAVTVPMLTPAGIPIPTDRWMSAAKQTGAGIIL